VQNLYLFYPKERVTLFRYGSSCQLLVLRHKHLDPIMVLSLADQISDRCGISRHLKMLAERLAETLKSRAGQSTHGGKDLLNSGGIYKFKAYIYRGLNSSSSKF
jgi:hypothetical protein